MKNIDHKILRQKNVSDLVDDQKIKLNIMSRMLDNISKSTNDNIKTFKNVYFLEKEEIIFAAYYLVSDHSNNDLYITVQLPNGNTNTFKINDMPIDKSVENYSPEILFDNKSEFLACVFIEKKLHMQQNANALFLKMYKFDVNNSVLLSHVRKIELNSYVKNSSVIYKYPIIIRQNDKGDFFVIAKTLKDKRAGIGDKIYVMWKIKDNNFEMVVPRSRNNDVRSYYLFKVVGYSNGKEEDNLIISLSSNSSKLNVTYVGNYLENYKFFSKIYRSSINYVGIKQSEDCLISKYRCIIDSNVVKIPQSHINLVKSVDVGDNVHIIYIGDIYNKDLSHTTKQLAIIANYGDAAQSVIYDITNFQEDVNALYVKYVNNDIIVTVIFNSKITVYKVYADDLLHGKINSIMVFNININSINSFVDLYRIIDGQDLLSKKSKILSNSVITSVMDIDGIVKATTKMIMHEYEDYKDPTLDYDSNHNKNDTSVYMDQKNSSVSIMPIIYNDTSNVTNPVKHYTIINTSTLNKTMESMDNVVVSDTTSQEYSVTFNNNDSISDNVTDVIKIKNDVDFSHSDTIAFNNFVTSTGSLLMNKNVKNTSVNGVTKKNIDNEEKLHYRKTQRAHNISNQNNILLPFNNSTSILNSAKAEDLIQNISRNDTSKPNNTLLLAAGIAAPLFFLIVITFMVVFRYVRHKRGHHRIIDMDDIPMNEGRELYYIDVESAIDRLSEELL
ncbi:hypothetical protein [Candidatus Neoehrlichia procyonis]|uniref:Uncharacterized protein n=1 Tax=Candidatus Neoehrlichia procyonis str. RAC413 TaxID=1359163 RepID=A0A0F3NN91_9RICK|nr:hypothetical protein [Candidatus Neoehrlichia lotoris]KJV69533.1 hypothetical protein NLO413_0926 [Candidatus Neoehrlichia lotoris str. RAC413]